MTNQQTLFWLKERAIHSGLTMQALGQRGGRKAAANKRRQTTTAPKHSDACVAAMWWNQ